MTPDLREKARAVVDTWSSAQDDRSMLSLEIAIAAAMKEVAEEASASSARDIERLKKWNGELVDRLAAAMKAVSKTVPESSFNNMVATKTNTIVELQARLRAAQAKLAQAEQIATDADTYRPLYEAAESRLAEAESHRDEYQKLWHREAAKVKEFETAVFVGEHMTAAEVTKHLLTCAARAEAAEAKLAEMTKERAVAYQAAENWEKLAKETCADVEKIVASRVATLTAALENWREMGLSLWAQFASYNKTGETQYSNMARSALEDLEDALHRAGLLDALGRPLWENINRALPPLPADAKGEKP